SHFDGFGAGAEDAGDGVRLAFPQGGGSFEVHRRRHSASQRMSPPGHAGRAGEAGQWLAPPSPTSPRPPAGAERPRKTKVRRQARAPFGKNTRHGNNAGNL